MSGTSKKLPDDWHLTFRAEGQGPPVAIRVRRLLKAALRSYGLRCISHVHPDDKPAANAPPPPQPPASPTRNRKLESHCRKT